jgi:hypothetical protein
MFAFFGLGPQEIVILLLIGLLPVIAVVVALSLTRRSESTYNADAVVELRAELARLREEVDRRKDGLSSGTSRP